jgi:methionyl-tRNA formyltransferase
MGNSESRRSITVKNRNCIFIGGRQIGANCLKQLLSRGIRPDIVVGNMDDQGKNETWFESLVMIAEEHGLAIIKGRKISEPSVMERIRDIRPEIIFCIGGMQIIPEEILLTPTLGCLNIHPALLPKYRGRYSTAHAIFRGEKYTGATVHWMDKGIDSGPIILQEKIVIEDNDTAKLLYDKFTYMGERLFCRFLDIWLSGEDIPSFPQDETEATYFPKALPNNGEIDWSWDGAQIKRFIRAMTFEPFPPPQFIIGSNKMVIVNEKYFKGF